jgi:hypothetical protein
MKIDSKRFLYLVLLMSVLSLLVPINVLSQGRAIKQGTGAKGDRPVKATSIPFTLPSLGAPGKRKVGAARRPNCPWLGDYLTALLPGTNIGLTISQYPTFWFDVPYGVCGLSVEFQLSNQQDQVLYKQIFPVQGTPGLVSIQLPPTTPPLEIGKSYRWRFTIILDPAAPFDDARGPVVEGAVLRVLPTSQLRQSLVSATPRERLILYGQNGLWFDLLAGLSDQYRTVPTDSLIAQDWRNVLQTVGLTHVIPKPLTTCCSPLSQK